MAKQMSDKELVQELGIAPSVDFMMRFEGGELESDEELVEGFQGLIDNGLAWSLQGCYGRMATRLIEAGLCHR